jgi:hypothetical protein
MPITQAYRSQCNSTLTTFQFHGRCNWPATVSIHKSCRTTFFLLFVLRLDSEEKHVSASDFSLALAFDMILIVLSMVVSAVSLYFSWALKES